MPARLRELGILLGLAVLAGLWLAAASHWLRLIDWRAVRHGGW